MKLKKIVLVGLLVAIITLMVISTISLGKDVYTPEDFDKSGYINTNATGTENIKTTGGKIVGLIQVVGTIVSVGMLIVLGIKYIMGSAEERAEYKKTLFPYFIGAVLIFGAANLTQVIYSWASKL